MYDILRSCSGHVPEREHVRQFVDLSFRMAKVYLRRRVMAGRLNPDFFGLTLDDLALDCIADLFERDDDGRFPHLIRYFEPILAERPSAARLRSATRRLVCSKVSEGLYRRYSEADPALHKLVRNFRYAIRTGVVGAECRIGGTLWVVFDGHDPQAYRRPTMGGELLELRLASHVPDAGVNLKCVLEGLRAVLQQNPAYAQGYPLIGLASVFRQMLDRMTDAPKPDAPDSNDLYLEDVRGLLDASRERVDRKMRARYVGIKLERRTFDAYIYAAEAALHAEFVESGADDASHFDVLRTYLRTMTYEEFRTDHRGRFQYLVNVMRDQFISTARRHLQ